MADEKDDPNKHKCTEHCSKIRLRHEQFQLNLVSSSSEDDDSSTESDSSMDESSGYTGLDTPMSATMANNSNTVSGLPTPRFLMAQHPKALEALGVPPLPSHPEFATLQSRIDSYRMLPMPIPQHPNELADAGFYYKGTLYMGGNIY
jgi:hypothetical protein